MKTNINHGIFVFDNLSAMGKTYLLNVFNTVVANEAVVGYTYGDYKKHSIDKDFCKSRQVILFDRYDRYRNVYDDLINELSRDRIILVDCKNVAKLVNFDYEYCFIELGRNKIEVYG